MSCDNALRDSLPHTSTSGDWEQCLSLWRCSLVCLLTRRLYLPTTVGKEHCLVRVSLCHRNIRRRHCTDINVCFTVHYLRVGCLQAREDSKGGQKAEYSSECGGDEPVAGGRLRRLLCGTLQACPHHPRRVAGVHVGPVSQLGVLAH